MLIVPGLPPLQETRHSRELGRRVEEVVRDYQGANPEMTEAEVRTALMRAAPGDSPDVARRKRVLGASIAAAVAAGFVAMASTGGDGPSALGWGIMGAVAAVGVVAVIIARLRQD